MALGLFITMTLFMRQVDEPEIINMPQLAYENIVVSSDEENGRYQF